MVVCGGIRNSRPGIVAVLTMTSVVVGAGNPTVVKAIDAGTIGTPKPSVAPETVTTYVVLSVRRRAGQTNASRPSSATTMPISTAPSGPLRTIVPAESDATLSAFEKRSV